MERKIYVLCRNVVQVYVCDCVDEFVCDGFVKSISMHVNVCIFA